MQRLLSICWNDNQAQDLVEYAMLLVFIAMVVITFIPGIATALSGFFARAAAMFP